MIFADFFGYSAGIINMLHLLPQLMKSLKTKSTSDISLNYAIIHVIGLSLWVFYGLLINSTPIVVVHVIETFLAFYLVLLKLKHG